jgi:hypothetical protein
LLFSAISFAIDDTTLRSTLIGGLVANAGAAVAFYFASKSSDQARRDILNASVPSVTVPNLIGKDEHDVNAALASTPLHLVAQPATRDAAATVVASGSWPTTKRRRSRDPTDTAWSSAPWGSSPSAVP